MAGEEAPPLKGDLLSSQLQLSSRNCNSGKVVVAKVVDQVHEDEDYEGEGLLFHVLPRPPPVLHCHS